MRPLTPHVSCTHPPALFGIPSNTLVTGTISDLFGITSNILALSSQSPSGQAGRGGASDGCGL